ncbi:MAG: TonB-dependent receptor [Candidatus Zixiibacteriota bacterium]
MAGIGKRLLACVLLAAVGLLLLPIHSFAATTGQIKGRVTHKDTGEPVIGASVLVVGTTQGAMTDLEGYFQILRVDPGNYTLRISHLEFVTVEVSDVIVKIDETFEANQKMTPKITDLDETITVVGTQDILDKFVVDSRVTISAETIKQRPVQSVDHLLSQVAGVQTTAEGEVFVRGGRAGEVAYIVDGVPIGDPLGSGRGQVGANLSLVSGSIQEIQIIKDGFDPEYGNALSGIVNIRSFTGDKTNTRANLYYLTDDFGNQDLNKYSRNNDYMRFTLSGPDPLISNRLLPAIGLNFLKDQEFTYFLYADVDKHDGIYQMQDFNTPTTTREWPSFGILGFDVPERLANRYHLESNFRFRPRQNLKFVLSYKKWYTKVTLFNRDNWAYRYSNLTAPVVGIDESSISLETTHTVSRNMNYEVILSVYDYDYNEKPGDPNNPGKTRDPDKSYLESEWETFTDRNGNGVYDAPEPLINLYGDTANYGNEFNGPAYTFGEYNYHTNQQGGVPIISNFRFNDNGMIDSLEGEPYVDLNGNGVWDQGDYLNDRNGNGILDADRIPTVQTPRQEPFVDGDSVVGEPFVNLNANGVYDAGIDVFFIGIGPSNQDLNHNGIYDGPGSTWTPGVPFLDRDGDGLYDPPNNVYDPGEPFTDVNGNGKYDRGGASTFLEPGTHDESALWNERTVRRYRGEVKLVRQMNRHEVKAGFFFQRENLYFGEIERPYLSYNGRADTLNAYPTRGLFRDFYKYEPVSGAIYIRDKIEYGSMVASLGLRWDFFLQDTEDLARVLKGDDRGGLILGDRHRFAPRIGFSYPISDKAKVYFNYGHFFQLPSYYAMYRRNTTSADQNDVLGNPNLNYQKTIQYSFGIKYAMNENYTVDVEGYFKDEFDKINSGNVFEGELTRQQYLNKDYGRSRGFEITLERRGSGYVNGQVSYAYAFAFGKDSKSAEQFERDLESREPLTEAPLDNDYRHTFKAGIGIVMPQTVKPRMFGVPIPNGWSLSIESIIQSGAPFTPSNRYPGLAGSTTDPERNSLRFPMTAVFDIRFTKEYSLVGLDWQFILWVENLFNRRNVVSMADDPSSTGRPDTRQNQNGVILGGTDYDNNPYNWDYGRQIRFGLEVSI